MNDLAEIESYCEDYLRSIASAERSLKRIADEREQMRGCIDGVKAVRYDKGGASGGMEHGDDAMFAIVERLEAVDARIVERANGYAEKLDDWERVRSMLSGEHAEVLELHYMMGRTWEQVALDVGYSERSIYMRRWDALLALYELIR